MCNFSKSYKFSPKGESGGKKTNRIPRARPAGQQSVLENVALLFLFIAESWGAERVLYLFSGHICCTHDPAILRVPTLALSLNVNELLQIHGDMQDKLPQVQGHLWPEQILIKLKCNRASALTWPANKLNYIYGCIFK